MRRVNITQVAQNGGTPCPDEVINATELRECNTVPCPGIKVNVTSYYV